MNHPHRTFGFVFLLVALVVTAVWVAAGSRDETELRTPALPVADATPEPPRPEPPPPVPDAGEGAEAGEAAHAGAAGRAGGAGAVPRAESEGADGASGADADGAAKAAAEAEAKAAEAGKIPASGPKLPVGATPYEPEKAGPRKVEGTVEDADRGDMIASALVTFNEVRPGGGRRHYAVFRTDEKGRFSADGLKEAVYEMTVVALGTSAPPRYSNDKRKIDLTQGDPDPVRVMLKAVNTTLRVRLEDARGNPVAAPGMIAFRRPGSNDVAGQGVSLDAGGEGTIALRVDPGEWEVGWWPQGASGPKHFVKTTIYAGANGPLVLRLPE